MPIIRSAKKQLRQSLKKRSRNFETRRALKDSIKAVAIAVKAGKAQETQEALRQAYKIIDTASKKYILPFNTAARKKSKIARWVAKGEVTGLTLTAQSLKDKEKTARKKKKEE